MRHARATFAARLGACALLAAVLVIIAIRHDARRDDIYRAAVDSPAKAAARIADVFGGSVCHPPRGDDMENALSALFALEQFAVSPLEREFERLAATASRWLGLNPPDFSYGPGQIRLSRALVLMQEDAALEARTPDAHDAAARLMDACTARPFARALVAADMALRLAAGRLSRDEVIAIAKAYNAQRPAQTSRALLANRIYNAVAYHLVLHFRYGAAEQPKAAERNTHALPHMPRSRSGLAQPDLVLQPARLHREGDIGNARHDQIYADEQTDRPGRGTWKLVEDHQPDEYAKDAGDQHPSPAFMGAHP
jgi:hypothetical protein